MIVSKLKGGGIEMDREVDGFCRKEEAGSPEPPGLLSLGLPEADFTAVHLCQI